MKNIQRRSLTAWKCSVTIWPYWKSYLIVFGTFDLGSVVKPRMAITHKINSYLCKISINAGFWGANTAFTILACCYHVAASKLQPKLSDSVELRLIFLTVKYFSNQRERNHWWIDGLVMRCDDHWGACCCLTTCWLNWGVEIPNTPETSGILLGNTTNKIKCIFFECKVNAV